MTDVVTVFLRDRGEVLLGRRSEDAGTAPGRWDAVSGYVEPETADPIEDARREMREGVGIDGATLVREGDPYALTDGDRQWTVHPFLFDVGERDVDPVDAFAAWEWVPAPAMRERETVPALWEIYREVAPSVETIANDDSHGSAWLSVRALEVLRDEAAVAEDRRRGDWSTVASVARELLDARPSMAALANRVNRAMATASGEFDVAERAPGGAGEATSVSGVELESAPRSPAAVVESAHATLIGAVDADEEAAATAAGLLTGGPGGDEPLVATLSRSGTVETALTTAEPSVLISESRPDREGVDAAARLADAGLTVTVTTDAALGWAFDGAADVPAPEAVLVGADTVLPDGSVLNKVGTRSLAVAADRADVPVYVVAARDKVAHDATVYVEHGPPEDIVESTDWSGVWNPIFDRTPADVVSGVATESGVLDAAEVESVARRHEELAEWN